MAADLKIPLGAPVWMDLVVDDVDAATTFYAQLFGWEVRDTPAEFRGYKYFEKDGEAVGGCMVNEAEWGMPNAWSIFLHTADAATTAQVATENGGEVLMPPMTVGENGTFCIIRDVGGAVISAWQPGTEKGFGRLSQDGAPSHFELHTRDYDKSTQFYKNVFGWNPSVVSDEESFRYVTFGPVEAPRAGIMDATAFLSEGVPAHWSVYIECNDIDSTVTKVQQLGGKLVMGIDETPYGRLATVTDPRGSVFKLRG